MFDVRGKIKGVEAAIEGNSFIRLYRGENRKNNLRRSRKSCLIIFTCVAAFMCFLYMSLPSGAESVLSLNSMREINAEEVSAKLDALRAEIRTLEETDTSDYSAADLITHQNNLENYKRSVMVLEAASDGSYDGKKISVVYVDVEGDIATFGTKSWSYNTVYRSFVLDFITMLVAIFISITVANVFGAEYSEKTVKLMFTKPSSRIKLYLCKMAVVFKEALIYSVIAFLILILVNWAGSGTDFIKSLMFIGNRVRVVGAFEQVFIVFLDITTAAVFYATLASLFSISAKSRVLPILCTILFSRLPELEAIRNLMKEVASSSVGLYNCIFTNHINLCQYMGFTQQVVSGTNFTTSYLVLLLYVAVMFATSAYAFMKQRAVK